MVELRIPLEDIYLDLKRNNELAALPEEQAIMELANAYSFLGKPLAVIIDNGEAIITAQVGKPQLAGEAAKTFQGGIEAAQRGNYERAIQLFKQALEIAPDNVDVRRNLAMAYLELKQPGKAKTHLLEALRLNPRDGWSNLLAGNILAGQDRDFDAAMKWYRRAYEINPQDAILLTNLGATLQQLGHTAEAADYFSQAMTANPKYPNAYYAAALLKREVHDPEAALSLIDTLFAAAEPADVRSNPLIAEARKLWSQLNQEVAVVRHDALMQAAQTRQAELGVSTGHRIEMIEDNSLEGLLAMSQLAWKYQRDYHLVRYRRQNPPVLPAILFHELQHIALVDAARKAGRNRYFAVSDVQREHGRRLLQDDVKRLQSMGLRDDVLEETMASWITGLTTQLFNIPQDMVIEHALFEQVPALRPSQFASLRDHYKRILMQCQRLISGKRSTGSKTSLLRLNYTTQW
jgi:Tfp pilus assembly protein PilF